MSASNDHYQQLDQQLCFPLYAASRLVTRLYQPLLEQHGLTYPQYIVLMILWQSDGISVKAIGQQALLNSNTLTPLLKRMEHANIVSRIRNQADERLVNIHLTQDGWDLKQQLACIPEQLFKKSKLDLDQAQQLKGLLSQLLQSID